MSLPNITHTLKVHAGDQMEMDLPIYGDDLPDVETTSPLADQQMSDHIEVVETSSSVAAPLRGKKRTAKVLPKDTRLELRNNELLDWNINYVQNMKKAVHSKAQNRMQQKAKKNAEHYVWGAGIGGLGRDYFGAKGPLNQFIGDNLFQMITGTNRNLKSTPKRDRDSGIDEATQEEVSRKRQKTAEPEEEMRRGEDHEGIFMLGGDEEIELPRDAAPALDDQQLFSAMPWNISVSKRGSSAVPLSGRVTMISEQGRQGSRAGSRMVSASPLLRRSTGHAGDFEALQSLDSDALGGDDFAYAAPASDDADVEELPTQPSLRVREALSAEGENFFAFVAEAVEEKRNRALAETIEMSDGDQMGAIAGDQVDLVTFEELLPPLETNKMVACQGFLMILSLGTKGMLDVQQVDAFESIILKATEKGKSMQILRVQHDHHVDDQNNAGAELQSDRGTFDVPEDVVADGQEDTATQAGDGEEVPEPDNTHFQEQIEVGRADDEEDHEEDGHDSLYDGH